MRTNFSGDDGAGGELIGDKGTIRLGDGTVFKTPSVSRFGKYHLTVMMPDREVLCSCEGWQNHKKCWHVELVIEATGQDEPRQIEDQFCEHMVHFSASCEKCNEEATELLEDM
jgi:hypothetical protein